MRKIYLLLLTVCFAAMANAQVAGYTFTPVAGAYAAITGTSPTLTDDGTNPASDEGYANGLPIGFSFSFSGGTYTTVNVSTNGFITFGAALTFHGFTNNLATGPNGTTGSRPIAAPLWDDHDIQLTTNLQYTTSGTAPNRVFVMQWSSVKWGWQAAAGGIDFQVRLYETTNVVEFVYNQLPGTLSAASASIGLAAVATGSGNFLSLNNASAAPTTSSTVETTSINAKPATGQVYRFTPPSCSAPIGLAASAVTATTATVSWSAAGGATAYEYAVNTVATPPGSGTNTALLSVPVTGLTAGTTHYLHVRTVCGAAFSGWSTFSFNTLCTVGTVPYLENLDGSASIPSCFVLQDLNANTSWTMFTAGGNGAASGTNSIRYNWNTPVGGDDWFFIRGLNLTAGTSYTLRFKYKASDGPTFIERLEVLYGSAANAASMTAGTLFSNTNINNGIADPFIQASINFTPAATGDFYIGFHCFSIADQAFLYIDDIEVDVTPLCGVPSQPAMSAITTTTATATWPETGSFILEYGPTGYTPGTGATAGATGTLIDPAVSPQAISGLTASTTYDLYVRRVCAGPIWSANSPIRTFTTLAAPPANDDPCGAIDVGVPSTTCTYTTYNNNGATATAGVPAPGCASYSTGDVWFSVTVPANGNLIFDTQVGTITDGGMAIYSSSDNTCTGTFTLIACDDDASTNGAMPFLSATGLTPGNVIFIRFWDFNDGFGTFGLCVTTTAACATPPQPTMSAITSTTATATWAGAGSYILEYGPTGYTPGTAGAAGATGTLIDPAVSPQAITGLTASTTYDLYVRLVCAGPTWSANSPIRTFTTLAPPPANDDAPGAIALTLGTCTGSPFTNVAATQSVGEPFASCRGTAGFGTVWYSFMAPASGAVKITNDYAGGTMGGDSRLAVFSTTDVNNYAAFTIIGCDDDNGTIVSGDRSIVYATGLTSGNTYYVQVDGFNAGTTRGTFCLSVEELTSSMVSTTASCGTETQDLFSVNDNYNGWLSHTDENGNLVALIRNASGTGAGTTDYSGAMNVNAAPVRSASGVYYLDRNYMISNSGTVANVDVRFFYLNSELNALIAASPTTTAANLGATRQGGAACQSDFSAANGTTQFLPQTGNGVTADGNVRWIQVQTPSFSNFYLQSSVGPVLPTGLVTFAGQKQGSVNKLVWTTSSEQNNRGFDVQRSTDGINFTSLGFVNSQGLNGASSETLNYTFIDNSPIGAKQYYRLRQYDFDNNSKLSNVVVIKGDKPVTLAIDGLYPNPANTQVNVIIGAPVRDKVTMVIVDVTGKTVLQKVVSIEAGSNTVPVDISRIANGTYLVKLVCSNNCESAVSKFVKQ